MSQIISLSLEEESKKNPELKKSDLELLKEWCQKQPHLPKISDSSLALFLHSNYYYMEPTKTTIDNYYSLRSLIPELFANRDPINSKDVHKSLSYATALPLKATTKEGYNIVFATLNDSDSSKFNANEFAKLVYMVIDLWIYQSGTNKGHILVFDVQNCTLGHAARINPMVMKKIMVYLQEGLPVRLKGLHYLHINAGIEAIVKMIRPFLKKELTEMLYMHPSLKTLKKFLPIEALPSEYGGKAGSLMDLHEIQVKELKANRDWFIEEEMQSRVDESKRPGKAKSASDLLGVQGSFKKLDID